MRVISSLILMLILYRKIDFVKSGEWLCISPYNHPRIAQHPVSYPKTPSSIRIPLDFRLARTASHNTHYNNLSPFVPGHNMK